MPGYKALPEHFSGRAAEHARGAEVLLRAGEHHEAARSLEDALETCRESSSELPGWLCGRLAALYRTLKRYDDEVHLLERYRDSQPTDAAAMRFDARLSKARALAARRSRSDTRALASVRGVMSRRQGALAPSVAREVEQPFSTPTLTVLGDSIAASTGQDGVAALHQAIVRLCDEARAGAQPPERLVAAIRTAWGGVARPADADEAAWAGLCRAALTRALTLHFEPGEVQ